MGVRGYLGAFIIFNLLFEYVYIMEILVRVDKDDIDLWYDLVKQHHDDYVAGRTAPEDDMAVRTLIQNNTSKFWDTMLEKYPYLRNKRIALNTQDGYVFSWNTLQELNQYRR
jgi:hypothetical protein